MTIDGPILFINTPDVQKQSKPVAFKATGFAYG